MHKISIIGVGNIGGVLAYEMKYRGLGEISLIDTTLNRVKGKSLDIEHAVYGMPNNHSITASDDYRDLKGSDVVIVTAGIPRKAGMTREDVLSLNLAVIKNVSEEVKRYSPEALVIIVTNPLDIMVMAFHKYSKLPKNMVVGMAGALDVARFRYLLSREMNVSVEDVNSVVICAHNDSMLPLIECTSVSGIPLKVMIDLGYISDSAVKSIVERTRKGGLEVLELMGTSAYCAPANCAIAIAEAYLFNKRKVMACSVYLEGEYGISDLCIGVPVIIGAKGVEKIIEIPLKEDEMRNFKNSADELSELVKGIT